MTHGPDARVRRGKVATTALALFAGAALFWSAFFGLWYAWSNRAPGGKAKATSEVDKGTEAAIRALFNTLDETRRRDDNAAFARCFDVDRLVAEFAPHEPKARQDEQRRAAVAAALAATAPQLTWTETRITRLRWLEPKRTLVIDTRHKDEDASFDLRWWAVEGPAGWRFYDREEPYFGLRLSSVLEVMTDSQIRDPNWLATFRQLITAARAVTRDDIEAAEAALARLGPVRFPDRIEALRRLIEGRLKHARQLPDAALEWYAKAEELIGPAPLLDRLRAGAYNLAGEHQKALTHAEAYEQAMGATAESSAERGLALLKLDRRNEALAAFRRGLSDDPASLANLVGLAAALPADHKEEFIKHFLSLPDPLAIFDVIAQELLEDPEALAALVRAARKLTARSELVDYFEGELLVTRGRYDGAAAIFRRLAAESPREEVRELALEAFLDAHLLAGDPFRAYRESPWPRLTFPQLADYLADQGDAAGLKQLVALHRKKHADDAWLEFYEGEALTLEENYAAAESMYAKGMSRPLDEEIRERYRASRVFARFHLGQWRAAYRDLGPTQDTFDQLANLMSEHRNAAALAELVAEQKKTDPENPDLALWDAEVHYLRREYAQAIAALKAGRNRILSNEQNAITFEDRLTRCQALAGQWDEALWTAEYTWKENRDPWPLIVVHALKGDAAATEAAIARALRLGHQVDELYADHDVATALRKEPLKEVQARYGRSAQPPR